MESDSEENDSKKTAKANVSCWKTKEGKKLQYKQKYKPEWENNPLFKGWLSKSTKGPFKYYCRACDRDANCSKSELTKHVKTSKHISNMKILPKIQKKISEKRKQKPTQMHYCKICDKKFQSLKHTLNLHKKSAKHLLALGDMEEDEDNIVLLANTLPQKFEMTDGDEHDNDELYMSDKSPPNELNERSPKIALKVSTGSIKRSTDIINEQKLTTGNGSFVILRCEKPLFPSSTSAPTSASIQVGSSAPSSVPLCANPEVSKLVCDISDVFKSDLANFLNRNEDFLQSVIKKDNFASGDEGIIRLTRLMVSHLANQYLSEYTVDSWKKECPDTKRCVASKLSELEQSMESSVSALKLMKADLETREDLIQPKIILQNMEFDDFC